MMHTRTVTLVGSGKSVYGTPCDLCHTVCYSENKGANRRRRGPFNLVCSYCFDWSVPRKRLSYYRVIEGSPFKPESNGKKFSGTWGTAYKTTKKRTTTGSSEAKPKEENNKENETVMGTIAENVTDTINKVTETIPASISETVQNVETGVKDAVQVVESGVSGLFHGAAEALSSLVPGRKRSNVKK